MLEIFIVIVKKNPLYIYNTYKTHQYPISTRPAFEWWNFDLKLKWKTTDIYNFILCAMWIKINVAFQFFIYSKWNKKMALRLLHVFFAYLHFDFSIFQFDFECRKWDAHRWWNFTWIHFTDVLLDETAFANTFINNEIKWQNQISSVI